MLVLLEGKNVNLMIMEKEDLPLFAEWVNKPDVFGEYNPLHQMPRTEAEKMFESRSGQMDPQIMRRFIFTLSYDKSYS